MMIFNHSQLATSREKKWMLSLVEAGMSAVLPQRFMSERMKASKNELWIDGKLFSIEGKRIFVIGAGKATATMAAALENILDPNRITAGMVISNDTKPRLKKIELFEADHPVPSSKNIEATAEKLAMKEKHGITKDDLIIALISGGGSALMTCPADGLSLQDVKEMTKLLLLSGADETELAVVRKKISKTSGGRLAQHFYPTQIISLVLSDVSNNDLSTIASGPFTEDKSTYSDAWDIVKKHGLIEKAPPAIISLLKENMNTKRIKKDQNHVDQVILADNRTAKNAMTKKAEEFGIHTEIEPDLYGESKEVALACCERWRERQNHIKSPTLFLSGGYTSVNIGESHGKGGRNQEFILACLKEIEKNPFERRWCIASIATDGVDFISESAGGLIDSESIMRMKKINMDPSDYLVRHDSYSALTQLNANVSMNGNSGTNVCDLVGALFIPGE